MKKVTSILAAATLLCLSFLPEAVTAHEHKATATYMGNEAILIRSKHSKVVFDPLFHKDFGIYQMVPQEMVDAMIKGKAPFNDIAAVFISHAHDDHFNARAMLTFLKAQPKTRLFGPQQALDAINQLPGHQAVSKQLTAVSSKDNKKPWTKKIDNLLIEAVSIAHAGWPNRHSNVENLVFRITLDGQATVMHMGDADPNDNHYKPYDKHWQQRQTDIAFPPYWFFSSPQSRLILDKRINAKHSVGVHVPVNVPAPLKHSGLDYFSIPGEKRTIK